MPKSERYEELDALRGLAALVVFFYHCILLLAVHPPWLAWLIRTPLGLVLYGGHQAVILFFVLSGFVLYLPYEPEREAPSYTAFIVKRICRIYLPYLGALFFFVLAYFTSFREPRPAGLSDLYGWRTLSFPAGMALLRSHVIFIGFFHREYWNGATWTLAEEMRISFVFPLLAELVTRCKARTSLLLAFGCSAAVSVAIRVIHHRTPFEPFHYASLFVLGAVLGSNRLTLIALWKRSSKRMQAITVMASVLTASYALLIMVRFPRIITEEASDWLIAVSISVFLIAVLADTSFSTFLRMPFMTHLGRTSYGIYLLHLPVLFVLVNLMWSHVPTLFIFTLSLTLTLILAHLFYVYLERPSMALGKRLARAVDRRLEVHPSLTVDKAQDTAGAIVAIESVSSV